MIPTFTAERNLWGLKACIIMRFTKFTTCAFQFLRRATRWSLMTSRLMGCLVEEEEVAILIGIAVWVERVWGQTLLYLE
ncbi:hypothetical protein GCG54_00003409 [Colletotrichum gloeosporioides]|uniref:Uncharacterized protein n=1 Tax=Colletotrichum gloeosporioides TaxID=474922 RepID=A0A8H4FG62_COLGL|nr:uncharacterized protein GCG54_00003409 [Colletotrichum gloeosporioides]KAF3800511.1 hypothetical protein GCG54_00003409 [Colletotrichum gloeosporioides]